MFILGLLKIPMYYDQMFSTYRKSLELKTFPEEMFSRLSFYNKT